MGSEIKNHAVAAAVMSLLLLIAFVWWFGFRLLPLSIYAIVALIATVSVPIIYRLFGYRDRDEAAWLEEREAAEHRELIARLKTAELQLGKLGVDDGERQARRLNELLEDYHSVVETRFIGKKHMPLEYLGAARQVQKQAVQNLSDVVTVAHSLSTIDSNSFGSNSEESDRQRLEKNSGMYKEQEGRMQSLLDENRQMFDALTETAVEVANIRSFSKYERIDTLARLVSLAQIANTSGK